jgi:uncharacterized protein (TIGR03067 family)
MMRKQLVLFAVAGALISADAPRRENGREQQQVIPSGSKWVCSRDGSVWEFKKNGGLRVTHPDGSEDLPARYVLNPKANPPHIDYFCPDGTALGIYRLKCNRLEVCLDCGGDERPTQFASGEEDLPVLLIFKQVK